MCTIGLMLQRSSRFPLVVAANRDESRERPARGPHVWSSPKIVAGRDEVARGTWLGINRHGLVVGLTNLWTGEPPNPNLASRGALVTDMLGAATLAEARTRLAATDPAGTNPYILVCAYRDGTGWWSSNAPGAEEPVALSPGSHAIGNVVPATGSSTKLDTTAREFADVDKEQPAWQLVENLGEVLATHVGDRGPQESVCVHTDTVYGTVSATIILIAGDLTQSRLFHAPGPPCTTRFEDRSETLVELMGQTGS